MIETYLSLLPAAAGLSCGLMLVFWLVSVKTRNAGWVDVGWSITLVLLAGLFAWRFGGQRAWIAFGMVSVWGVRLAVHVATRLLGDKSEDPRYQKIRADWGKTAGVRFFFFYQLQAVVNIVLAWPFYLAASNSDRGFGAWEYAGLFLWAVGVFGEKTADRQLAVFKKNPSSRGKVCRDGLWAHSRHPNYFFEWIVWIGYFVFACGSPYGWTSAIAPALMLYFVLFVSGIPPAEAQSLRSKGDAYRAYQAEVPAFFPKLRKS